MLQGRDFLKAHRRWVIGDGQSVRIWQDNWLPSNVKFPRPVVDDETRVSTLIDLNSKKWDVAALRQILPPRRLFKLFSSQSV